MSESTSLSALPRTTTFAVRSLGHEIQEARTEPDVEAAIRTRSPNFNGWDSDQDEKIGDSLVFEANPLQRVIREVPFVTGSAAIQLIYSNRLEQPRRSDVITHILSRRLSLSSVP
jgi:hypothetical protein